jgi:hypothetical protein
MSYSVKIDGIYDKRTLKLLQELNVNQLGFDFRPTSFNFIQHYKFFEMLSDIKQMNFKKVFLIFQNEPDFVIQKFVEDLCAELNVESLADQDLVVFDFRDSRDGDFYNQFNAPYIWTYDLNGKANQFKDSPLLAGVSLSSNLITTALDSGSIDSFCSNVYQLFGPKMLDPNFILDLQMNWVNNLPVSIYDRFDFNTVSLSIDPQVEVCYRNVDHDKLSKQVAYHSKKCSKGLN